MKKKTYHLIGIDHKQTQVVCNSSNNDEINKYLKHLRELCKDGEINLIAEEFSMDYKYLQKFRNITPGFKDKKTIAGAFAEKEHIDYVAIDIVIDERNGKDKHKELLSRIRELQRGQMIVIVGSAHIEDIESKLKYNGNCIDTVRHFPEISESDFITSYPIIKML